MESISFWIASLSRLARGRLRNRLIRRLRSKYASRNARSICSGVPLTAAGSGTPQCAVIGCPGHTGHISWAADDRSEEHTSELQSHLNLVCRLLLEKKKKKNSECGS